MKKDEIYSYLTEKGYVVIPYDKHSFLARSQLHYRLFNQKYPTHNMKYKFPFMLIDIYPIGNYPFMVRTSVDGFEKFETIDEMIAYYELFD